MTRRKARTVPLVLAALVGVSRVYLWAHHPLDVMAGAAFGTTGGPAALEMARRAATRRLRQATTGRDPSGAVTTFSDLTVNEGHERRA